MDPILQQMLEQVESTQQQLETAQQQLETAQQQLDVTQQQLNTTQQELQQLRQNIHAYVQSIAVPPTHELTYSVPNVTDNAPAATVDPSTSTDTLQVAEQMQQSLSTVPKDADGGANLVTHQPANNSPSTAEYHGQSGQQQQQQQQDIANSQVDSQLQLNGHDLYHNQQPVDRGVGGDGDDDASTSAYNPHSRPLPSIDDYVPEEDEDLLAEVKREIDEENEMRARQDMLDNAPQANQRLIEGDLDHNQQPVDRGDGGGGGDDASTLAYNPDSRPLPSIDDYVPEEDEDLLAEVKREIEEENEMRARQDQAMQDNANQQVIAGNELDHPMDADNLPMAGGDGDDGHGYGGYGGYDDGADGRFDVDDADHHGGDNLLEPNPAEHLSIEPVVNVQPTTSSFIDSAFNLYSHTKDSLPSINKLRNPTLRAGLSSQVGTCTNNIDLMNMDDDVEAEDGDGYEDDDDDENSVGGDEEEQEGEDAPDRVDGGHFVQQQEDQPVQELNQHKPAITKEHPITCLIPERFSTSLLSQLSVTKIEPKHEIKLEVSNIEQNQDQMDCAQAELNDQFNANVQATNSDGQPSSANQIQIPLSNVASSENIDPSEQNPSAASKQSSTARVSSSFKSTFRTRTWLDLIDRLGNLGPSEQVDNTRATGQSGDGDDRRTILNQTQNRIVPLTNASSSSSTTCSSGQSNHNLDINRHEDGMIEDEEAMEDEEGVDDEEGVEDEEGMENDDDCQDGDEDEVESGNEMVEELLEDRQDGYDGSSTEIEDNLEDESSPPVNEPIRRQSARSSQRKRPNYYPQQQPEEEGPSGGVKRARTSRPNVTTTSTQHEGHIIARTLQCPHCQEMIVTGRFSNHLKVAHHSLLRFACLVKNCGQQFDHKAKLGHHIRQSHRLTQWPCGQCGRQFGSYKVLYSHNSIYHQRGQFECSVSNCAFTGEYRGIVLNHYRQMHSATYKCNYPGCHFESHPAALKRHQRIHSGVRPFRCTWPKCRFSSAQRCNAIRHVRVRHLSAKCRAQLDPKDYVDEVY